MAVLRKLSVEDGKDIFEMLKGIGSIENSFTNPVHDMSFNEYKNWLIQQDEWSRGNKLPAGYVPQTIYWLFDGILPVGIGKIRHGLTEDSRKKGGNIGYAISSKYRGRGYGCELLHLLLGEAHMLKIEEILLTVEKCNPASKKVIEKNGGTLFYENENLWYFEF